MKVHEEVNGVHCDRVMVFPQDNYSVEAMGVLQNPNFRAAISRPIRVSQFPSPRGLAQPARSFVLGHHLCSHELHQKILKVRTSAFNVLLAESPF